MITAITKGNTKMSEIWFLSNKSVFEKKKNSFLLKIKKIKKRLN